MAVAELSVQVLAALQLALWLSVPALVACALAGLVTGTLQAATQVQDPALSFVPRLLAVALALSLSGAWMQRELVGFTNAVLAQLAQRAP
ncbi:MAG: flagellar biosynthetic protein FliQ [Polyangiales bacterium]